MTERTLFMFRVLLVLSLIFNTLPAFSKVEVVKLKRVNLGLDVPKNWFVKVGLMGMPLVLISKSVNNQKASLSFTPTKHEKVSPSTLRDIKGQFSQYKSGREVWMNKRYAKLVKFFDPKVIKNEKNSAAIVGFEYIMDEKKFAEYSINIFCKDRYIFSKLLYEVRSHPDAYTKAMKTVSSLDCKEWK